MRAEINYEGKHYVCEDKEVLADIQNGYANAKKGYGCQPVHLHMSCT